MTEQNDWSSLTFAQPLQSLIFYASGGEVFRITPEGELLFQNATDAAQAIKRAWDALKWQPIETAPKDGKRILLVEDGRVFEGAWDSPDDVPSAFFPIGLTEDWQMRVYGPSKPTRWMPLPVHPTD